ncbi:MAG: hypothetical protein IT223_03415 [Crocinitomicaceae bacterium]|nr:hypothetical protein [Crocinitomicaceae bacterium]
MRFESYLNAIQGYSPQNRFKGTGIGNRFVRYKNDLLDVTFGNFYEQFGSGLTLRSYWEPNLGIDNALDGARVIFSPDTGAVIKAIYGHQRLEFDSRLINANGIVRGIDGEFMINDLIQTLNEKETRLTLGGSFVSKFQKGGILEKDSLLLELPENIATYAGRLLISRGPISLSGEYSEKINDPNADNGYIYKKGRGIFLNASYSIKGLGISGALKSIDNLSFRSDRNMKLFDVPINYIPALTKQHTYNLAATLYPYATPFSGEVSYSAEVFYNFKKETLLGGKYGTQIAINYVAANSLDSSRMSGNEGLIYGYRVNSLGFGPEKYVRDFNLEVKKKASKELSFVFTYYYLEFNTLSTPVTTDYKGIVYADIEVVEAAYKFSSKDNIRAEIQALQTQQDKGDWATIILEYTRSPHWTIALIDQYNYGNLNPEKRVHYLYGTVGYINGASRITLGYGKRREGVFCIGGVCRAVPATNGFELTITTSL